MEDRISVIVPVYNVETYIRTCLDSIQNQSYKNLEVILVDDGSTDDSGKICDEYRDKDIRFRVFHQENKGVLAARNVGIERATGSYFGFVDSDDWIAKDTYKILHQRLTDSQAEMILCRKNIYNQENGYSYAENFLLEEGVYSGNKSEAIWENFFFSQDYTKTGLSLNLYDKLFCKELILKNYRRVDTRLHYFEDVTLALLCMVQAKDIEICNEPFYYYRQRKDSLCHSIDPCYLEQLNIFYKSVYPTVAAFSEKLLEHLHVYIADRAVYGLNCMMGLNLKHEIPFYFPPFVKIPLTDRVVLYGAGEMGRRYHRIFQITRPGQIVLWVDQQYDRLRQSGLPVDSPEVLLKEKFDKILIAVQFKDNADKIREKLIKMGIDERKIIWDNPTMLIQV